MFKFTFHAVCVIATVLLCAFWAYKYSLNEDTSLVEYRMFYETPDDPYPIASMCFRNYFFEEKLLQLNINESSYLKYLNGDLAIEQFSNVDYDNLTRNIENYIVKTYTAWTNGTEVIHEINGTDKLTYQTTYSGFIWDGLFVKCFAIEMPDNNDFHIFGLLIHNGIFPNGFRPANYDFSILMHYPNQFLRSMDTFKYNWKRRDDKKARMYEMVFTIRDVEVHKYRNKYDMPCNEDWGNHDSVLLEEHLMAVGCRTPYQKSKNELPICDCMSQMKAAQFNLSPNKVTDYLPPCVALEKLTYSFEEADLRNTVWDTEEYFWLTFRFFNPRYKMIVQHR